MYCWFFFQAEDGIRDLVRSRGLGDVYKRQKNKLGESTKTVSKMIQISANECSIDSFANKSLDLSLIHI